MSKTVHRSPNKVWRSYSIFNPWLIRMANEALERSGMFFDDLNRIRVLDEETSSQVNGETLTDFNSGGEN